MLVLTRKRGQSLVIDGGRLVVTVVGVRGGRVRLGVVAPAAVTVRRDEAAGGPPRAKKKPAGPGRGEDRS